VLAFCRIDDREIRLREPVAEPDALIVQDATLLHQVDLFSGLRPDGYVLINSPRSADELGVGELSSRVRHGRLLTVPATELALRHIGRPIPNTALLGGFCAISGVVSIESLARAVGERFDPDLAASNVAAARDAYAWVETEMREVAHAPAD
jgi:pyruvate ferredoxin oxidoreductase gamma subunit